MAKTAELAHTRTHALFLSPSLCLSRTVALSAHSGLNERQQGIRYLGSSASQNSLKPIPSTTLIGLMSLHMNEIIFCVQASCRAADNELVADGAKYVSSRGCFAEVPHIRPYSLGCTFWRCSLKLLVVEWLANSSLT